MKQSLPVHQHYSLKSILLSHGWSGLDPFKVNPDYQSITFAFSGKSKPALLTITQSKNQLDIETTRKLNVAELETLKDMFGLGAPLDDFFKLANAHDRAWIQKHKLGRLMRAETVFEDLIKLILTTNCTWSLTKKMVSDLCKELGEEIKGVHCFPKPDVLAKQKENFFKDTVKTGYRAPFISKISKMVASGELDVESWKNDTRPYIEMKKQILSLPGAGPYVAENLLRYLGKYDGLGVDSWVRGRLKEMWNARKQPDDKKILKQYKKFNEYKGLMLWCDVTKDWHVTTVVENSKRSSKISG